MKQIGSTTRRHRRYSSLSKLENDTLTPKQKQELAAYDNRVKDSHARWDAHIVTVGGSEDLNGDLSALRFNDERCDGWPCCDGLLMDFRKPREKI